MQPKTHPTSVACALVPRPVRTSTIGRVRALVVAAALAAAQPTATIQKPKPMTVTGGPCRIEDDGTLGVNVGPNAAMPGAFRAKKMHANLAKFAGPGKNQNELMALSLGKTALEDASMGLGAVVVNAGATLAAAAITNTCDLITKAEMEQVLGVPMRNPEPQIMGMCEYKSVGDHPYKSVRLMLNRADSRDAWERHERELDAGIQPTPIPNIADETLFWNRMFDARVAMIKSRTTLTMVIDVGKMSPKITETLPVAHRLAEIAAPRLP